MTTSGAMRVPEQYVEQYLTFPLRIQYMIATAYWAKSEFGYEPWITPRKTAI
jgi:hypothetical protein